jgi:SAM-dependent methyltransferase
MVILCRVPSYWKTSLRPAIGLLLRRGANGTEGADPSDYTTTADPMEVAVQKEAYFLALNEYVADGDAALDVGCGLGYGLNLLSIKAAVVDGVDVDERAIEYCTKWVLGKNPKLRELHVYDGYHLPYEDKSFDVVTTIDVIEHVDDYDTFLRELCRVARRAVVVSTPNRRPEFTNPDGSPRNHWHLREWSRPELEAILAAHPARIDWYHVNGPWEGPHTVSTEVRDDTQTLTPVLRVDAVRAPARQGPLDR